MLETCFKFIADYTTASIPGQYRLAKMSYRITKSLATLIVFLGLILQAKDCVAVLSTGKLFIAFISIFLDVGLVSSYTQQSVVISDTVNSTKGQCIRERERKNKDKLLWVTVLGNLCAFICSRELQSDGWLSISHRPRYFTLELRLWDVPWWVWVSFHGKEVFIGALESLWGTCPYKLRYFNWCHCKTNLEVTWKIAITRLQWQELVLGS